MQNRVNRMIVMMLMAAVFALPAMAQWSTGSTFPQTEAPAAAFRSTSSLTGSGSTYTSAPMFSADGTAAFNDSYTESAQPSNGPRRVGPPTPGGDATPIGDAALPLLLMALLCVVYRRTIISVNH